ncbi:CCR4-NOT transcription complex subunit 1-like [Hordeum vulgare subsp. vulgare]|uniref:CCR4-NOT transcription complex subunit 1 n=4 Tax=Hordeum vulgare TaxID=4513 RepID=A0A8I6Y514_HORVV|nr:CCR4-NOT transcription complex subunit 1-like [Hordeum vulgare subsp. vulgare]
MVPLNHPGVAAEVRLVLQGATDADRDSVSRELCQLVDYGHDGCLLMLQVCLDEVLLNDREAKNLQLKHDLLSSTFRYCLDKTYFSTCFCEALMQIKTATDGLLETLSSVLELSAAEKVGIGLALSDSDNSGMKLKGQQFAIAQIEELCLNPNQSIPNDQIHEIVVFLHQTDGLTKHMDTFSNIASLLEVGQSPFFAPIPKEQYDAQSINPSRHLEMYLDNTNDDFESLLSEIGKEISMADIVIELGYGCTVDSTQCKEILSTFQPLDDVAISKLLGAVIGTQNSLGEAHNTYATFVSAIRNTHLSESPQLTTWNTDVLVDSINELVPSTNWVHVMENLDHEGFSIPDEAAFCLLMNIYGRACKDPFPLHAVCGSMWTNTEGQISFLKHAISAPATIFTFAHSSRLLALPDFASLTPGNHAWSCLDLLEVLCQLAEVGHTVSVRSMLEFPLGHCPELLLVGLGHINTAYNLLQFEVLSCAFPALLKDATKRNVLNHLWHINPCLTLRGFVDAHSDPSCLLRIVGVCHDLKILSAVLESTPFAFSIRLAAAACRKDHSHLEKWLTEKLTVYKDGFVEECVNFLKEAMNATSYEVEGTMEQPQASVVDMYWEACPPVIKVLQSHLGQLLSNQLSDELRELYALYDSRNQGLVRDNPTSEGGSDDVEVEANAYFHQMFSGQINIDVMIQMLARFKESPDKREQSIFNCMISNLFEEYKFFTKYPDKQLKLAAVLFGSLIKHQLVAHLGLGIALRAVLDALRKSVDSKMFMFGTTALEQFMDRVIEWPQYCNHILQISHLRATHAEMVSAIERALARISSSQNEPNSGNFLSTEQLVSGSSSIETMEASEPSWQLMGTSPTQLGRTPYPLQQRQPSVLGDRSKVSIGTSQTKSILPSQPSVPPASADSAVNLKTTVPPSSLAHSTSMSNTAHSTNFLRPRITSTVLPRQHSYTTGFGNALNIETLVAAAEQRDSPIETPPSEVQDKILFMINNISTSNMEAKAKEFSEVLQEQYYPWFAQYMVMKRASIEPNFHDLYLKFFDKLNSRSLSKEMLKATYENCKVLLRSDLIKSSSEERSLLKNLGSWLGKFTIGRNQTLRAKEIDPKSLIVEAYERGLMIAVIPFTSKILEPCHSSIAYRPPNPWTMGILSLLAEIYNLPNLKMNLKFDIEVLFKNLGVDMKDVKPTSLLKDRGREVEGNPDFSNKDVASSQTQVSAEVSSGINPTVKHVDLQPEVNSTSRTLSLPPMLNQYTAPVRLPPNSMSEDDKIALMMPEQVPSHTLTQVPPSQTPLVSLSASPSPLSLTQLLSLIPHDEIRFKISSKLLSLGSQLQFSKIMGVALDKAIKEIILPVIERSVSIASKTTKEIILKDYSTESDYSAANRSARLMVGTLAGSLAHVTCKEPLRVALKSHLRSLIQNLTSNSETGDQVIHILINDNLDLGCASIESVATRKAVDSIEGEITQSFSQQRKKREAAGPAYYDSFTYAQGPFAPVPEVLHTKAESPAQQRVYEEFVHVWQSHGQSVGAAGSGSSGTAAVSSNFGVPRAYSPSLAPASSAFLSNQTAPLALTQPTELVYEELIPGAAPLSSDSPAQVGTSDSSGWLGGTIGDASTSPPLMSNDLPVGGITDLNAMMPPPATVSDNLGSALPDPLSTSDAMERYEQVSQKLEVLIAKDGKDVEIQSVIAEVPDILLKCVNRDEAALAVAQKVFKSLYDNSSNSGYVMCSLATLVAIRDVCNLVVKELMNWVIYLDDEKKFHSEIIVTLIRSDLLDIREYTIHLAKLIDGGRNKVATEFATSLVQTLITQDSASISELYDVLDALSKISRRPGSPDFLQQLTEIARNNANNAPGFAFGKDDRLRQSKDKKVLPSRANKEENSVNDPIVADSVAFQDQVAHLFSEWCQVCDHPSACDAAYSRYVLQLQHIGLLKGDEFTERFFRILTELAVAHSLVSEQITAPGGLSPQSSHISYFPIDSYSKLVSAVLKNCSVEIGPNKGSLLPKILLLTIRIIQKEAEEKKASFNPRPYFRLFINWLNDLITSEPHHDGTNLQVLTAFANAFHVLQPLRIPSLSFAWLELVSHRTFMARLLKGNSQKGWPFFHRLLIDLFKFMEPYLRTADLLEPVHLMYKGTMRVLLVLLHDFPEFLCDYHFSFCDVIPSSCIQMRNVILSAFPRNMRLPDPSTPNLKIDLLAEISVPPRIMSDVDGALKSKHMKTDVDEYLKRPEGSSFLSDLKQKLLLPQNEANVAGTRYNVPLMNSLVLYIGIQAVQQLQVNKANASAASGQQINHSTMDIFQIETATEFFKYLVTNLDTEGRYLFLNAIANQLRYPNSHTHYFSFIILYLFAEATQEHIQEQVTRVLLERLIVNRPHPWGLLITFIELIKNPRYNFWNRSFTHCAPEIKQLFESVAKSCGGAAGKAVDDGSDGGH